MIFRFLVMRNLVFALLLSGSLLAQEDEPSSPAEADLMALVEKINTKFKAGPPAGDRAEFFAEEIGAFTDLRTKYAGERSEDVAAISLVQASFHAQVLEDLDFALTVLNELVEEFPGTEAAGAATNAIASVERQAQQATLHERLIGAPAPELDFTWATADGLTHLSDLRGKVVVLDFWATWCGPCVRSFPQVRELTEHYAGSAVEVVGVTSLQGRVHGLEPAPIVVRDDPAKEHALMNDYIAKMDINWTIAFSEQEVFNPDYGITGIPHMAIVAPDGTLRHVGLHPAMPHDQKLALIDALLEEFELPVPEV
ncbi:MAG: TlpA family protein disulfide reductase [Opitutaceae bacterium]|nr:TlpA family protein disulfide reductase [Opitutaceae bacterium]